MAKARELIAAWAAYEASQQRMKDVWLEVEKANKELSAVLSRIGDKFKTPEDIRDEESARDRARQAEHKYDKAVADDKVAYQKVRDVKRALGVD